MGMFTERDSVQDLEKILGSCTSDKRAKELAVEFVQSAHRTNKQSTARFMLALIDEMAKDDFDFRNQNAVILAQELKVAADNFRAVLGLPYV
jgi:hypothetical protein